MLANIEICWRINENLVFTIILARYFQGIKAPLSAVLCNFGESAFCVLFCHFKRSEVSHGAFVPIMRISAFHIDKKGHGPDVQLQHTWSVP